ncbi:MAG: hypothetical protein NVS9B3_00770 [Gemmatimonadaceae bacterium]
MLTPGVLSGATRTPRRLARRAFTLVELLVAMVLLSIVLTTVIQVMSRQQQFYTSAADVADVRRRLRGPLDLIPGEFRTLSPSQGDIYTMSDSSIEYRAPLGVAVICTIDAARTTISFPPSTLAKANGLTAWLETPLAQDSLLIVGRDSVWRPYALQIAPATGVCPLSSGFVSSAAEGAAGFTAVLLTPLDPAITAGALVRFFRRTHLSLFQGSDANWYLGRFQCIAGGTPACGTLQAMSGPYRSYAASGPSGVRLTYFDSAGTATSVASGVRRIHVTTAAATTTPRSMDGAFVGPVTDSLAVDVGVRNNRQ